MLLTLAAFGAGLVATLVGAAWLTPRSWWRRANARALAVLAGGTFGIGTVLLWCLSEAAPASANPRQAAAAAADDVPVAGATYRTFDNLNLRESTGINARRVAVVPEGAGVTATGARAGDWWEISAHVDGREVRGWASSLWLRRVDERP
jgi:hypothetical protein